MTVYFECKCGARGNFDAVHTYSGRDIQWGDLKKIEEGWANEWKLSNHTGSGHRFKTRYQHPTGFKRQGKMLVAA